MRRLSPIFHIGAIAVACLLVFVLRIGNRDLQPLFGAIDDSRLRTYTPYFPGLANLGQHEIFSPRYAHTKKIVFLGASAADSIGCDLTWSYPDPHRIPNYNAHYSCTIASQMNVILRNRGITDWRAFDLARNGAKLTPMLYIYSQILRLKPEIVVFGESFPIYMQDNADAGTLNAQQYAQLDRLFSKSPETAKIWASYKGVLAHHGWKAPAAVPVQAQLDEASYRPVTANMLMQDVFTLARNAGAPEVPPLPVEIGAILRPEAPSNAPFVDPDPGFGYFQGMTLIGDLQRQNGDRFAVAFLPMYQHRYEPRYLAGLEATYGGYLVQHGIADISLVAMPLKPNYETYDGTHQTVYGNYAIAGALLKKFEMSGILKLRNHAPGS